MHFVDFSKREYITLEQYLYLKTCSTHPSKLCNNISDYECKLFNIKIKPGWYKINKSKQIEINVARTAAKNILGSYRINKFIRNLLLQSLFYGKYSPYDDKYVYLFINNYGHSKIGVSADPSKRLKQIECSSGNKIVEFYFWSVKDSSTRIESLLHKQFSENRTIGEWFNIKIDPSILSSKIPCEYVKIK